MTIKVMSTKMTVEKIQEREKEVWAREYQNCLLFFFAAVLVVVLEHRNNLGVCFWNHCRRITGLNTSEGNPTRIRCISVCQKGDGAVDC